MAMADGLLPVRRSAEAEGKQSCFGYTGPASGKIKMDVSHLLLRNPTGTGADGGADGRALYWPFFKSAWPTSDWPMSSDVGV